MKAGQLCLQQFNYSGFRGLLNKIVDLYQGRFDHIFQEISWYQWGFALHMGNSWDILE